jgi:hypothetical protein
MNLRAIVWLVPAISIAGGCRDNGPQALRLALPSQPGEMLRLVPESAFAEFVEHPDAPAELRITLADYPVTCDRYRRPPEGHFLLNVVLETPLGQLPESGAYPFRDPPKPRPDDEEVRAEARASLVLRKGDALETLPPGGILQLTQVKLETAGKVVGTISYAFVGDKNGGPASIEGNFSAEVCRAARLRRESRAQTEP